jgi:GDSL-like lipase/acylhydrolase family protein
LLVSNENAADVEFPKDHPELIRVVIKNAATHTPLDIQLNQFGISIKREDPYVLTFKARAARPRTVNVAVSKAHGGWDDLGLYKPVETNVDWQTFRLEFKGKEDDRIARINFDLGSSDAAVEFEAVTLQRMSDGKNIERDLPPLRYMATYNFNGAGCRGRDSVIPAPQDKARVVVLGNSYAMGVGVHEEDTFSSQLEALLNERASGQRSGKNYEVSNCGVSGYSARENRLFYEIMAANYEPQLVVLVLGPEDDRSDSDGLKIGNPGSPRQFADPSASSEEIVKLNNAVQKRGTRLTVVIFSNGMNRAWAQFAGEVTKRLKDSAVPVLDLGTALLKNHSEKNLFVYPGLDLHPNELAHAIAAKETSRFLQREGLLASR